MKKILPVAILSLVLAIGVFAPSAKAASTPVTGWAWSSNVGWIQFDTGVASPVVVSTTTDLGHGASSYGAFRGHAWSSNVGWLSFEPNDVAGCPTGFDGSVALLNGCNPTIDLSSGAVTGWARVRSMIPSGDGWLQLSGQNHNTSGGGGVKLDPVSRAFSGYAYEPSAVGWIDFTAGMASGGAGPDPVCLGVCPVTSETPIAGGTCKVNNDTLAISVTDGSTIPISVSGVTGGTGTYTYQWNPNGSVYVSPADPYSVTYSFMFSGAGTYTPRVKAISSTNSSNWKYIDSCPSVTVTSSNPPAAGAMNLMIVSGGTPPTGYDTNYSGPQGSPATVKKGGTFTLAWAINSLGVPVSRVYRLISSENIVDWSSVDVGKSSGFHASLPTTSTSVTSGTYHFKLKYSDDSGATYNDPASGGTVILKVTRSSLKEI